MSDDRDDLDDTAKGPETYAQQRQRLADERREILARARAIKLDRIREAKAEAEREAERQARVQEAKASMPAPAAVEEIDPHGLFSPEELAEIRRQAVEEVKEEMRVEARARLLDAEKDRARREAGLPITPKETARRRDRRLSELTDLTINLPEGGGVGIRLDGQFFYHNRTYEVTRAQYETLCEIVSRAWQHQALLDGKRTNYYNDVMRYRDMGPGRTTEARWRIAA